MTQLKDVIHLYLGCEVEFNLGTHGRVTGSLIKNINEDYPLWFKPILRPLSDMTEQEGLEYANYYGIKGVLPVTITEENGFVKISIGYKDHGASLFPLGQYGQKPETLVYLLSKGFDLFGLIESGQAISKTAIHPIPGE